MKKYLSIFFLLVLSLPTAYKVGFFTFYQLNKDYISENYCINKDRPITMCYGKCFLDKGLQLSDQVPNPYSLNAAVNFEMTEFLVSEPEPSNYDSDVILTFSAPSFPALTDGVSSFIFHPPLA